MLFGPGIPTSTAVAPTNPSACPIPIYRLDLSNWTAVTTSLTGLDLIHPSQ
jgi:hypothetical protein